MGFAGDETAVTAIATVNASLTQLAFNGNITAHQLCVGTADRQPQPCPHLRCHTARRLRKRG